MRAMGKSKKVEKVACLVGRKLGPIKSLERKEGRYVE